MRAAATRRLQDYVKEKLLPYKYPREVKFVGGVAQDRHGQDRSAGGDADVDPPPFVVPANAGTHNHRQESLRQLALLAFVDTSACGYGSRLSAR